MQGIVRRRRIENAVLGRKLERIVRHRVEREKFVIGILPEPETLPAAPVDLQRHVLQVVDDVLGDHIAMNFVEQHMDVHAHCQLRTPQVLAQRCHHLRIEHAIDDVVMIRLVAVPEFTDDRVRGVQQEAPDQALWRRAPLAQGRVEIIEILREDEKVPLELPFDAIGKRHRRRKVACAARARKVSVREHGERRRVVDMLDPRRHGLVMNRHVACMVAVIGQYRHLQLVPDGGGVGIGRADLRAQALPQDHKIDTLVIVLRQLVHERIVEMDDVRRAAHLREHLLHAFAEIGKGIVLSPAPVNN
mgnify:CR=1 FL=1